MSKKLFVKAEPEELQLYTVFVILRSGSRGMEGPSTHWTKISDTIGIISHPASLEKGDTRGCPLLETENLGCRYAGCARNR